MAYVNAIQVLFPYTEAALYRPLCQSRTVSDQLPLQPGEELCFGVRPGTR